MSSSRKRKHSENRKRTRMLTVRLLDAEFDHWHISAGQRGISAGELVRRAVAKDIGEPAHDQVTAVPPNRDGTSDQSVNR